MRSALYLRSVIFGINDSLVSTVGLLAGINVAGVPKSTVVMTGAVYALVEAFSMAMGSYLSEESGEEYESHARKKRKTPLVAAAFMFVSFAVASLIPLFPYIVFESGTRALVLSVIVSVIALFVTGAVSASLSKLPILWRGVRMAVLGGMAIVVGVVIGLVMPAA